MECDFYGVGCKLGSEFGENGIGEVSCREGLMFNMKHEKIWPDILTKIGAKENAKHTV